MKGHYPKPNERGFTLLEVMVALAIVSIALVVMLGLLERSILINNRLQQMTRATLLAKQKMAEIETGTQQDSGLPQGVFPEPHQQFSWRVAYSSTPIQNVEQIDLSVFWGEEKDTEFVTLSSFLRETQR